MAFHLEDFMTAQEAARELGVSRPRIHQLVRANRLDAERRAARLFVRRSSVEELSRHRTATGRQAASKPMTMRELRRHRDRILSVADRHGAGDIRVFGSVARGQARSDSDVDFLVTMEPGRSVIDLAELIVDLEEILERPVDVVEVKHPSSSTARFRAEAIPL